MQNILAYIKYSGIVLISILFMGVKCQRPETIGPKYIIAPIGFNVNSFSKGNPTVNFTTAKDTFYATFTHPVSWTITLRGLKSNAEKRITGTSQVIDGSNPSWLWDGGHDGLYFFKETEKIEAVISFLGTDLVKRDTLSISLGGSKIFKDVLVGNLETLPAGWISFSDPGEAVAAANGKIGFKDTTGGFPIVQGRRAFELRGTDLNNSYFIAGMRKDNVGSAAFPDDPSEVYLNVFIYGEGNPNAKMNFGAQEDDDLNGSHNPTNEDEFQVQVNLDHVGWKLFSYKYSDLAPAVSITNGGSGPKNHNPKKIKGITFALISSPPGNNIGMIIDFPIITYGGPFDPNK